MKIDGMIQTANLSRAASSAKELEDIGYDGGLTAEMAHDPFFPILLAAQATERIELGTGIAVGVRAEPDDAREHRLRPPAVQPGPVHPRPREPDQGAHREAVLDAVVESRGADARVRARHARDLGDVERRREARLPRGVLPAHPDDAVLRPGPQPVRQSEGLPRRGRREDDGGRGRGVRRRSSCTASPPSGTCARCRCRPSSGDGRAAPAPGPTSRSRARCSW